MVRRTAAVLAALAFALTCLLGALTGSSLQTALGRALMAMGAFFLLGLGLGWAADRLLREHLASLARDDEKRNAATGAPGPPAGNSTRTG
jgi:NhaP-type Na+/H+ or K+/H+ antiporter